MGIYIKMNKVVILFLGLAVSVALSASPNVDEDTELADGIPARHVRDAEAAGGPKKRGKKRSRKTGGRRKSTRGNKRRKNLRGKKGSRKMNQGRRPQNQKKQSKKTKSTKSS